MLRLHIPAGKRKFLTWLLSEHIDLRWRAAVQRVFQLVLVCMQLLLFNIPVLGPLLFVVSSAAAAFLADFLDSLPKNKQYQADNSVQPAAAKMQ